MDSEPKEARIMGREGVSRLVLLAVSSCQKAGRSKPSTPIYPRALRPGLIGPAFGRRGEMGLAEASLALGAGAGG